MVLPWGQQEELLVGGSVGYFLHGGSRLARERVLFSSMNADRFTEASRTFSDGLRLTNLTVSMMFDLN